MNPNSIGILGAGTWGIALAAMLAKEGKDVTVWSALPDEIASLSLTHRQKNLPDLVLPTTIRYTTDIRQACLGHRFVVLAVPSVFVRQTARAAAAHLSEKQILVDVAKGIESETLLTMSEIISEETKRVGIAPAIVALSGPTHAEEVARDIPTVIVAASENLAAAEAVQDFFMNTCLRVYTATDVHGTELCGAIKNVFAIAAGVSAGLGYGDNTAAALMTRGVAELARLGTAMGCPSETFYGLAGIGDVIVTATSLHSRNRRAGMLLAKGLSEEEVKREVGMVVEGLYALPAACALAQKYAIEMPIIFAVRDILSGTRTPEEAVHALMTREKKREF